MYYEVIYESGAHSVAEYADDDEALSAINAHVERAKAGEPATASSTTRTDVEPGPTTTWPAERVVKVLVYDRHPDDYSSDANNVTADVANKTVADIAKGLADKNGVVSMQELAVAVAQSTNPRVDSKPHETNYKMKEVRELEL